MSKQKEIVVTNMLRLYDTELLERLNHMYNENGSRYESKNHFLTDLIEAGFIRREHEDTLRGSFSENAGAVSKSMDNLAEMFTEFIKYACTQFQSIQASSLVARRMLSSTNNLMEAAVLRRIVSPESIKNGSYDGIPERFEDFEKLAERNFVKDE